MRSLRNRNGAARVLVLVSVAASGLLGLGLSESRAATSSAALPRVADSKYVGADKCKTCHGKPECGDPYALWQASPHAKAFEQLSSEASKKLAAEKGIADPATADACVKCHVTAFGVPEDQIKKGFKRELGVQCEACHGPGEAHMKARLAAAMKGDAGEGYAEIGADEILARPTEQNCRQCHNEESPSYKEFCFHDFGAKVRHLHPKKPRTEVDIGTCSCPKCANGCPDSCKEYTKLK